MARHIQQSSPRNSGSRPAYMLPVIIVLVILASGIGFVYAYPTIAHYFQPQSGLAASVQLTNIDGQTVLGKSTFSPLAIIQEVGSGGAEVYSTQNGGSGGDLTYSLGAAIQIQTGTAVNYTISGRLSMLVNAKNVTSQPIQVFNQGAPPTSQIALGSVSQTGAQMWNEIGVPTGFTTTQYYGTSGSTEGSVTVCFTEGPCEIKSWNIPSLIPLSFEAVPDIGSFTVSVQGGSGGTGIATTSTSNIATTSTTSVHCYSYTSTGMCLLSGVELPNLVFCQDLLC